MFAFTGFLTPVGKKDKDHLDPNNSRGIIISLIIAKVYKHVLDRCEPPYDKTDLLQFGFTNRKSLTMASLLTTEAIAENTDNGQPTYIATLDTQTAFDIVYDETHLQ